MSELFERNGVRLEVKFKTKEYGKFPVDATREEFVEKLRSTCYDEKVETILEAIDYLSKEDIYQVEDVCLGKGRGPSSNHIIVSTYLRDFFITPYGYPERAIAEFWYNGKRVFIISDGHSVYLI